MEKKLTFDRVTRPDGSSEFDVFLESLPPKDRAKLIAVLAKTEQYGMQVAIRQLWVKKLTNGIFELRSRHAGNIQRALYFHEVGNRYLITHGFTKKTDKTPKAEIEKAQRIMKEYLEGRD